MASALSYAAYIATWRRDREDVRSRVNWLGPASDVQAARRFAQVAGGGEPTCVSFRLSPSYGILTALEAHEWFLRMMQGHEQFEGETDRAEELPIPFWSDTVRRVVVDGLVSGPQVERNG